MNKKAFEMTINMVVVLVLALIMLSIGIYIIYTKILKPSEGATSVLDCQARKGHAVTSCSSCPSPVCMILPGVEKGQYCCIESLTAG